MAGGIDVPQVLGSRSTALRGGFGGLEGRPLQRGDVLACGRWQGAPLPASGIGIEPPEVALSAFFPRNAQGDAQIRAIPAGEYPLFAADAPRFWSQAWKISLHSNRTGYRLAGEPILPAETVEMRSYGLIPGIVQVPPAGEPIIQLSDANTAGGYPKIACVIEEDLWRLGQLQAGQSIQLVQGDTRTAIAVRQAIERWLQRLRVSVAPLTRVVGL